MVDDGSTDRTPRDRRPVPQPTQKLVPCTRRTWVCPTRATSARARRRAKSLPTPTAIAWPIPTGCTTSSARCSADPTPGWAGRTSRRPPPTGCRRACPPRRADRATCSLTDVIAEHIPGCNMAFHRWAFELGRRVRSRIPQGGRRRGFLLAAAKRRAGHRVQRVGHRVALPALHAPGVQNSRKATARRKACCASTTSIFFGPRAPRNGRATFTARRVLRGSSTNPSSTTACFGHGLFQSIYPTPRSVIADYVSSVEWFALTLFYLRAGDAVRRRCASCRT